MDILTNKHKCDIMGEDASGDVGDFDGGDSVGGSGADSGAALKITGLKQGVKNPDRVNVFVNGKFSFSLDVSQVVDLKVKVGRVISPVELAEFKKASDFGKLYQRALEWVLARPRSRKEVYDYLYRKIYDKKLDKNYINEIIDKLTEKKYVDDRRFAKYYVENRFVKRGISARRMQMELVKKGISKEVIEEVLADSPRNDEAEILKIIAKKRARYDDEKLVAYLCRQGFSFDLSRELVRTYETDSRNLG